LFSDLGPRGGTLWEKRVRVLFLFVCLLNDASRSQIYSRIQVSAKIGIPKGKTEVSLVAKGEPRGRPFQNRGSRKG
jgi:hypothetical protein